MKYKYSKYVPNLLDELDMDELMSKLSDLLMSSGFGNPRDTDDDSDRTMQALHDAILEALFNGGVLPDDLLEKLFGDAAEGNEEQARNQLEELIQQIIERMKESGYITAPELERKRAARWAVAARKPARRSSSHRQGARFPRVRRCAICLAPPATAAQPPTRATCPPASGQRRAETVREFGDTLNLDARKRSSMQ